MLNLIKQWYQNFQRRPIGNYEVKQFALTLNLLSNALIGTAKTWDEVVTASTLYCQGKKALEKRDRLAVQEFIEKLKAAQPKEK